MQLSYEEYLQLKNGKEELVEILKNTRIASEELTSLLAKRDETLAAVNAATVNLDLQNIQKEESRKQMIEREDAVVNKEASVASRESAVNTKEAEINEKIESANALLAEIQKQIEITVIDGNNQIDQLNHEIENSNQVLEGINKTIDEQTDTYNKELSRKAELENENNRLSSSIEEARQVHTRYLKDKQEEREGIERLLEKQRLTIGNPLSLLKDEQDKLNGMRNDLEIISNRLRQQFIEQNPEKRLPIELQ